METFRGREGTDVREGALILPCQGLVAASIVAEEGKKGEPMLRSTAKK
jgi:hypothetical protein